MSIISVQALGLVAGGICIFASLPQIFKIIKTKRTNDISLPMYIVLNMGVFIWIVYGFITQQPAIIITNAIFQFLNLLILYLKIKYG